MFQFGIGDMFATPTGGNLATPSFPQRFGVLQDVNVDIDQKLAELRGQNKFPDDVAPSDMTMKGKGGFAQIEIDIYNALYFADTVTANQTKQMIADEAHTVTVTTATVSGTVPILVDLGVKVQATGQILIQVPSAPAAGQYSVNLTTGVYTFNAAQTGIVALISYVPALVAAGRTLVVNNHIQGYGPIFDLWLRQPYQGANGMHLFACRASKMSAPMKRDGYLISDFEFQCFANAAGQIFEWFQTSL